MIALSRWAVPCPWDLCTETLHKQTLSSLLESDGKKFRTKDILQNVLGTENVKQALEVAGCLARL